MRTVSILLLSLITISLNAQDYWVSTQFIDRFDESHELIQTNDGGFLSVGTKNSENLDTLSQDVNVTLFDPAGNELWNRNYIVSPLQAIRLDIGVAAIEIDEHFYVAASSTSNVSLQASITKLDQNGDVIDALPLDLQDINELIKTNDDHMIGVFYDFLTSTTVLRKYNTDFEQVWETNLEGGVFGLFESHAYIDNQQRTHLMMLDGASATGIFRYVLDADGAIAEQDTFNATHPGFSSGVMSTMLSEDELLFIPQGNIASNEIDLNYINLSTNDEIGISIREHLMFIEDIRIVDERIYILGQTTEDNWPGIVVLEKDLSFTRLIRLRDIIEEADISDLLEGASMLNMNVDNDGNLIMCGYLVFSNTSYGFLNMYVNKFGNLAMVSTDPAPKPLTLSVFPNPTQDYIELTLPFEPTPSATIQVYDQQGQLMIQKSSSDHSTLNVQDWPSGSYYLLYTDSENIGQAYFQKI